MQISSMSGAVTWGPSLTVFKQVCQECRMLLIDCQRLGREETKALDRAMESRVEEVMELYDVTLDTKALANICE